MVGAGSLGGLAVLRADSPELFAQLRGRALPLVVLSVLAGAASLVLIATGRYALVRVTAALAVAAVLWSWGAAQYPVLLRPDLTVDAAAGDPAVLAAVLGALSVGAVLLLPSLRWLFAIFQRAIADGPLPAPTAIPGDLADVVAF